MLPSSAVVVGYLVEDLLVVNFLLESLKGNYVYRRLLGVVQEDFYQEFLGFCLLLLLLEDDQVGYLFEEVQVVELSQIELHVLVALREDQDVVVKVVFQGWDD